MNAHVSIDGSDWAKAQHARNVAACNKLLGLLYFHHADAMPAFLPPKPVAPAKPAIEIMPAPTPEPVIAQVSATEANIAQPIVYSHTHYIHIQRVVAKHFGISRLDLVGQSRRQKYAIPRQVAMYLVHDGKRTLPEIGRRFGGRDHTTVLHAVRKIERWVEQDLHDMQSIVGTLRAELAQ